MVGNKRRIIGGLRRTRQRDKAVIIIVTVKGWWVTRVILRALVTVCGLFKVRFVRVFLSAKFVVGSRSQGSLA